MKICIIYGHHNTKSSFNAAIRDTFIEEAKKCGHEIDLVNLFDEKEQLPFYNSNIRAIIESESIPLLFDP